MQFKTEGFFVKNLTRVTHIQGNCSTGCTISLVDQKSQLSPKGETEAQQTPSQPQRDLLVKEGCGNRAQGAGTQSVSPDLYYGMIPI